MLEWYVPVHPLGAPPVGIIHVIHMNDLRGRKPSAVLGVLVKTMGRQCRHTLQEKGGVVEGMRPAATGLRQWHAMVHGMCSGMLG